jgi:hypothetical protein
MSSGLTCVIFFLQLAATALVTQEREASLFVHCSSRSWPSVAFPGSNGDFLADFGMPSDLSDNATLPDIT